MSDENAQARPAEAPESPAVVKKAVDTIAKGKTRPKPTPARAPESVKETPTENTPESGRVSPPETPGKSDNALSIFGWDV